MIQWIQVITQSKDFKAVSYYAQENGSVLEGKYRKEAGVTLTFYLVLAI